MINRKLSFLFAVLAVLTAAAGIYFSFSNIGAEPTLAKQPEAVRERVETLMDAVCRNDYDTVSAQLYGQPKLGIDREADTPVGALLWNALEDSRSYRILGECYATNTGLAWDVSLTCLDIDSVTANLRQRSQALLEERVANAEDMTEVYDENNEYREDFVMQALYDAAVDALAEDTQQVTYTFTLQLTYADGQWWILPASTLLEAISGGVLS